MTIKIKNLPKLKYESFHSTPSILKIDNKIKGKKVLSKNSRSTKFISKSLKPNGILDPPSLELAGSKNKDSTKKEFNQQKKYENNEKREIIQIMKYSSNIYQTFNINPNNEEKKQNMY